MELAPSLVIEFDPPLTFSDRTVSEIELREPTAVQVLKSQAELTGGPQSQWKFGMALVGAVSGQPRQIIEQMPVSKLMKGINYLTNFLNDDGLQIGENSSSI